MAHVVRRLALSRRTILRGAGASVALPLLDAMTPALARPQPAPRRYVFVFAPNGKKMDEWTPADDGPGFALPYLLEPLQPLRRHLTVFSGLALDGGRAHGDGPGDHARAAASFLTGAHPRKTGGGDVHNGPSIDQVLAPHAQGDAPMATLELGMEPGRSAGACDSGYSCAYSNHVSWRDAHTPVAKETDPKLVFARLFGDPDLALDAEAQARRQAERRSVLDAVRGHARSLARRLPASDRTRLDEYLQAVREVEQRLQQVPEAGPEVALPDGLRRADRALPARLQLMYELIALALRTDRTRVVTFMLGNAGSNRSHPFLDVPEGHHELSHHKGQAEPLARIRRINRFHVEQLAAFAARLQGTTDGDGSLLDHSAVVYGSAIGDGNRHDHHDLPLLVLGGGGGLLAGDRHLRHCRDTPLCNLYLTLLRAAGAADEAFGDSTGALALS